MVLEDGVFRDCMLNGRTPHRLMTHLAITAAANFDLKNRLGPGILCSPGDPVKRRESGRGADSPGPDPSLVRFTVCRVHLVSECAAVPRSEALGTGNVASSDGGPRPTPPRD